MLDPTPQDHEAVARLATRVPWMLQRAAALREAAADPRVQLAALAPRWLAGMAAVAALAITAALLWPASTPTSNGVDGWVLSGSAPQSDDPVVRALMP
ncbi:MAG TPA: hypothetical protein VFO11_11325 [Candidatus Polarisedimenticolaceae bacterium]|nr:hypothetical protein [Candidatus Polarisedimenticolaceae bacterium]